MAFEQKHPWGDEASSETGEDKVRGEGFRNSAIPPTAGQHPPLRRPVDAQSSTPAPLEKPRSRQATPEPQALAPDPPISTFPSRGPDTSTY